MRCDPPLHHRHGVSADVWCFCYQVAEEHYQVECAIMTAASINFCWRSMNVSELVSDGLMKELRKLSKERDDSTAQALAQDIHDNYGCVLPYSTLEIGGVYLGELKRGFQKVRDVVFTQQRVGGDRDGLLDA